VPIKRRTPPTECSAVFDQALRRRWTRLPPPEGLTIEEPSNEPQPQGEAWPVYSLSVVDVAQGIPLAQAGKLHGWRFLVELGSMASAEVVERDGRHQLSRWNHGGFNRQMAEVRQRLSGSETLADGEYELRVLVVPGLCVCAVWVFEEASERSLVVPLAPTDPSLEAYREYTGAAFLTALNASARQRLLQPDPA
jgi:hypothetical protein